MNSRVAAGAVRTSGPAGSGIAVLMLTILLAPGLALAQAHGDPAEGGRIAVQWCSGCHQVGPETQTLASDAIASFLAIAAMPSTTSMSLRAFLSTAHPVMPDFRLTNSQIDDVGAYILSLRCR